MYGGGYQYPPGYGPPPGSYPPPGGSPYAQAPGGYPPPSASPPLGYGAGSPPPQMGYHQQPPPGPGGFSGPPPFVPPGQGMPMGGPPGFVPQGRHAGLGAPGQAPNLPPPPNLGMSPSPVPQRPMPTGEVYSLFIGSIAEGVDDAWLERILGCAGPLLTLRRIKDANGRPKAFGFAEYGDPESVLRCIEVLNGADLPVDGGKGGLKPLKINADEKTRAKLDSYEKTRIKTDQDTDLDNQARERLAGIVSQMRDPSVLAASLSSEADKYANRPTHLQDLAPEDLPEESRGLITKEIQFFRERAMKRESEKREQREEKISSGYYNKPASAPSAGPSRQNGPSNGPPPADRGWGSPGVPRGRDHGSPHGRSGSFSQGGPPRHEDPQSFNRPVAFVRAAQQAAEKVSLTSASGAPLTDAEEDQMRADRKRQAAQAEFRDRERRWLGRERTRGQALAREAQRDRASQQAESERRSAMRERLALWDDDLELEKGRELFLVDRSRWRATRRAFKEREEADDRMDVEHEQRQIEAAKRESEAFLSQQADLFAQMSSGNGGDSKGGLLQLDDGVPIKLSFGGTKVAVSSSASQDVKPSTGGVLMTADDEDDGFKRKRELIPLTYDDVEMEEEKGMTEQEKLQRRQRKVREIVASIPSDKESLFEKDLRWEKLNETIITEKLRPFANKKLFEHVGLQDDELVEAVVSHVRKHKGAPELVQELEPVLAEEAEEFTIKFWRMLVFELLAVEAGLDTTS